MILREALANGVRQLKAAQIDGAARDARALVAKSAGIAPDRVSLEGDLMLQDPDLFEVLLQRRIAGEPISKILGKRMFWGREFIVTRDTLDPRPETETIIAAALEMDGVRRIADLGTGTGILAISLLKEWPTAQALATDVSAEALAVAKGNADTLGVSDQLKFRLNENQNIWLEDDMGSFDLIVSNPPYISDAEMAELSREVFDHDPHIALTPGGDGLGPYREIATQALAHLNPLGHLMVEIGWQQGLAVKQLFQKAGLVDVRILPDMDGRDRVVQATKP